MRILLTCILFIAFYSPVIAQSDAMYEALEKGPNLTVQTQMVKLNKTPQPAFSIDVIGDKNDVEDAWEGYLEEQYQIKLEKKKGLYTGTGVSIPLIAPGFLALYATLTQEDTHTRLNTWVDLGGEYLDGNAPNAAGMKTFLSEFMESYYREVYKDVLDDQNKELSSLTKNKDRLQKDAEKLQKDVSKRTGDIEDAKEDTIDAKQKITELNTKIEELASDVQKYESEIVALKKEQVEKQQQIEKQLVKVEAQRSKLEALRMQANKVMKQK